MRYQLSDIPPDWRLLRLGAGLGLCVDRVCLRCSYLCLLWLQSTVSTDDAI